MIALFYILFIVLSIVIVAMAIIAVGDEFEK